MDKYKMEENHIECSKCGSDMQAGCIMAPSKNAFGMAVTINLAEWYTGKASWWNGMPKETHPITVYRCKQCGYLECYAK